MRKHAFDLALSAAPAVTVLVGPAAASAASSAPTFRVTAGTAVSGTTVSFAALPIDSDAYPGFYASGDRALALTNYGRTMPSASDGRQSDRDLSIVTDCKPYDRGESHL